MKVPFSWLKDYVDIDCTADELVVKLFSCGFEVEGVEKLGKNIDRIVTCKITKIEYTTTSSNTESSIREFTSLL